tara:strand:- start:249 stop:1001 length:753 start_codon:yes stop_codon:yes gene_type:complete
MSCSDDSFNTLTDQEYEKRILEEATILNTTLTKTEIKERIDELRKYSDMNRFDDDISNFVFEDSKKMPPLNSFLFIGSSSIRYWESLKEDMAPFLVINRGFGGAHIAHVNKHFSNIVEPYMPKAIIFFCGSNDINALKNPMKVVEEFRDFYAKTQLAFEDTKVFVISIKPSIARDHQRKKQNLWNEAVRRFAKNEENLVFIDIVPSMMTDGKANPVFFTEDGLHMNKKGYALWTKIVKSILKEHFEGETL